MSVPKTLSFSPAFRFGSGVSWLSAFLLPVCVSRIMSQSGWEGQESVRQTEKTVRFKNCFKTCAHRDCVEIVRFSHHIAKLSEGDFCDINSVVSAYKSTVSTTKYHYIYVFPTILNARYSPAGVVPVLASLNAILRAVSLTFTPFLSKKRPISSRETDPEWSLSISLNFDLRFRFCSMVSWGVLFCHLNIVKRSGLTTVLAPTNSFYLF